MAALSKPGFEQQWKSKLDNQPRGAHGLAQGVTASGVTLFVPMSVVAGSSNNVYGIDNDLGYVVWQRHFDAALPAATAACAGGITSAATRIVKLDSPTAASRSPGSAGAEAAASSATAASSASPARVCRRKGVRPVRAAPAIRRRAAPARRAGARSRASNRARARGAAPPPPALSAANQAVERIPGAPRAEENASPFAFLFRPSGVGYVVSSDGMLHVLGLASGKDIQRPAPFLPANAKWSAPVAVDTTLYAATSGKCGGAPDGVWAIDLDSDAKPVVSWKTNGGGVVGAVAFTPDGTLIAAIGPGQATGDGKANAIVALDPKTLQVKDWFSQPTAEFVTGPTILRHNNRNIVAAATKDGRVLLLDAASLGGSDHATPLAASKPFLRRGRHGERGCAGGMAGAERRHVVDSASGSAGGSPRECATANGPVSAGARGGAEVDGRGRRALARAGLGLARPLLAGHAAHRQRCRLHAGDRCRRRRDEAVQPFFTPTTARPASGCGTAARR